MARERGRLDPEEIQQLADKLADAAIDDDWDSLTDQDD